MIPHTHIRKFSLFIILLATSFSYSVHAQGSQFKIGVVNMKNVFDEYDKQKEKYKELQIEVEKLQEPINQLSDKITENKKKYEDKSSGLSDSERKELQDRIETDFSRYKADVQQSQEEVDRKEKRIFEEVIADIQVAVEEVGAKENYHLIFDGGKNRNNNLLYYSTTLNMTQKVIDHLNK